jgi:hypothetical protein
VVDDLAAGMPDLQAPLRDLVTRQSFGTLLPHARSGGGSIQRDALIQEISRIYHPALLVEVQEVLNGFLDTNGGIVSGLSLGALFPRQELPMNCTQAKQDDS